MKLLKQGVICLGLLSDYMNRLCMDFDKVMSIDLDPMQRLNSPGGRGDMLSEYLNKSNAISAQIGKWKVTAQSSRDRHSKNPLRWLLQVINFGASSCQSVLLLATLWNLERPEKGHEKWDRWVNQSKYTDVYDLYGRANQCTVTPKWTILRTVADPLENDTWKVQDLIYVLKTEIQKPVN